MDHLCLVFLVLSCLFIAALWSPTGKGLTSWLLLVIFIIPAFFFRKKGYINFVSKSVRRPSVRLSVCPSVRASVCHVSCKCISS